MRLDLASSVKSVLCGALRLLGILGVTIFLLLTIQCKRGRDDAERAAHERELKVSELPSGVAENWTRFIESQLHSNIKCRGGAISVESWMEVGVKPSVNLVSDNTPYTVHCDWTGGYVQFGLGDVSSVQTPLYGVYSQVMQESATPEPELGVDRKSIAAGILYRQICSQASTYIQQLTSPHSNARCGLMQAEQ